LTANPSADGRPTLAMEPESMLISTAPMTLLTDHEGRRIRLTDERWRHIVEHPEMASMREALEETLAAPESVVESLSDPAAKLYYRFYQRAIVGGKYMCVGCSSKPG